MAKHKSLPYRPALDGLRGVAVAAVVIYHVSPSLLRGGWLGVDLFFVLSGFLITSLLLTEYNRWGRISLAGFWASRARRLLPSLTLMLLAVLIASAFLAQPGRRSAIAGDVLSSFLYVANWRFLVGDEQYFSTIAMPSPVRHTWSLAIEEQYYILFPLLMTALLVVFRRRNQLAGALAVMAVASALWMAALHVPGVDPSRVYYGTDTRIFELLIGAAAGAVFGAHEFAERTRWRVDGIAGRLAWPAMGLFVLAFVVVNENQSILFTGGLFVLCLLVVLPIVASASRTKSSFQRAFSWEPLRQLGLISYSLYLWHWPVIVFLGPERIPHPLLRAVVQIGLSVGLAYASYRFVEQPVRTGGFRALVPGRPTISLWTARLTVPLLVAGIAVLPHMRGSVAGATTSNTKLQLPPYQPLEYQHSVTILGNSIPASLAVAYRGALFPDLSVNTVVNFGCEPWDGARLADGKPQNPSESCSQWRGDWPGKVRAGKSELTMLFTPQSLVSDWQVGGRKLTFGTPEFEKWLGNTLTGVQSASRAAGAKKFAVINLACHRVPRISSEADLINDDARVRKLNAMIARWGAANKVTVIDQYGALCTGGYHDTVNGVQLYRDTLHFTSGGAEVMWRWLAPRIQIILQSQA
ncbi:acyltransferase [Yimella sp. cx-573]|nr:acyltransferase [Yimella sp. cx-573]